MRQVRQTIHRIFESVRVLQGVPCSGDTEEERLPVRVQ